MQDERRLGKVPILLVRMNSDLAMGDVLLKKTGSANLFMVFGEPDVAIERTPDGIVVEIRGVDVYNPTTGEIRSSGTGEIALWMIDTDYDGESFFVRHCYFTGGNDPYARLKRALKADIDEAAWAVAVLDQVAPVRPPADGQDRGQGDQPLRRRGPPGLRRVGGCPVEYTEAQLAAIVTIDDPLLIVACAGSGKTQVISQRIIEILRRPDVKPSNIVAFTFTEKAAAELKERVTNLVTEAFGNVIGLAELFIGTMHGYALDALQTHVAETFKYGVLDDIQTRLLIDRHSRESGLTKTDAIVNGQPRKLRRYVNSRLYMQVTNILREDDVDGACSRPSSSATSTGTGSCCTG